MEYHLHSIPMSRKEVSLVTSQLLIGCIQYSPTVEQHRDRCATLHHFQLFMPQHPARHHIQVSHSKADRAPVK